MLFPFEIPFENIEGDLDPHVDAVISCLQSEFMALPKGTDFVEYPLFARGYEALKKVTIDFHVLCPDLVVKTVYELPISLIVLRTILGLTPPEWAYLTAERGPVTISQSAARSIERRIRAAPETPMIDNGGVTFGRIRALVATACALLTEGAGSSGPNRCATSARQSGYERGSDELAELSRLRCALPDATLRTLLGSAVCRTPRFSK
jgi:hypothetical protein